MKTFCIIVATALLTVAFVALAEDAFLRHERERFCRPNLQEYSLNQCALIVDVDNNIELYGYDNWKPFRWHRVKP